MWELLIIHDGSTDDTKLIIKLFTDSRILYFEQPNQGVSAARNVGLSKLSGDFFCFLDGDDLLPKNSLQKRINCFRDNPTVNFVDGLVTLFSRNEIMKRYQPGHKGQPLKSLFRLSGKCFVGLTWMIRRDRNITYCMSEQLKHGEDLLFFMEISRSGGLLNYVDEEIYCYRKHPDSAMHNLSGLEMGYWQLFNTIRSWPEFDLYSNLIFQFKVKKFMFLDWVRIGNFKRAILALLR